MSGPGRKYLPPERNILSKASKSAFEAIRAGILDGRFKPGEHLKEEVLAEVCGVSRTPIRDALRQLAADNYVTIVPNRGTFVTEWSVSDIEDIFTLRSILEGQAARLAATRASDDQIGRMSECCDRIKAMLDREEADAEAFVEINRVFHAALREAAGSKRLDLMIKRLTEQAVVTMTARSYGRRDIERSNAQHSELVDAIRARDGDWAHAVMVSHLHGAYRVYQKNYLEREAGAAPGS